jgi:hypothetical protein
MTGRAIRHAFVLALLSLGWFALSAGAATVVQVRVGPHPTFTRVVFELDAPSGYRVERQVLEGESAAEIVVTLEASSRARSITSRSKLVDVVSVDEGVLQAVARIRLHKPDLRLREMILADPPRIVLDVMGEEAEVAVRPAARTQPPAPKPKPEVVEAAAPKPKPEVVEAAAPKPPAPKPAAAPQPPPKPELVADEPVKPPAPKPAAAPPMPEPEVVAVAPVERPPVEPEAAVPPLRQARPSAPEQAEALAEEPDSQTGGARPGMVVRRLEREEAKPPVTPAAPAPRRVDVEPEPASTPFELRSNLVTIGAVALGALVVVVALIVFARRRSLPNDADVMLLAEDGSDASPVPAEGFAMDESESEPVEAETAEDPFSEVGESESTTSPEPGLLEEPDKGESAMDTETHELPSAGDELRAPPKFSGEEESDLARVVREMERRMAHLETRLDESIDARERLERQVAAQTEELRVQRAAIARTQRALRGLSRSEEEQATEPALRDPAKPSFPGS